MRIERKNPVIDDLQDIQRDLGRFFRRAVGFGTETVDNLMRTGGEWMPAIDVYAENGDLVVKAELSGVDPKDVNLTVKDNALTISGERKAKKEINEENVYRLETNYGKFQRTIELPKEVNPEDVKASYSNGVLEVRLPGAAKEEPKEHKVQIKFNQ